MYYRIPNNYLKNSLSSRPAYLRGYQHFLYFNLDVPITDSDFDEWEIALYDINGLVADEIGVLQKDIINDPEFRFYVSFTIPISVSNSGDYYIVIYNSVSSIPIYQSKPVRVISEAEVDNFVLLSYRNSTDMFNFNYETVTDYNTVFLPMNVIDQQAEITVTGYKEKSTGLYRNQKAQTNKVLSLEGYFFDEDTNDMMLAISVHDDILISGKSVKVKTAYKVERDVNNSVNKGVIELYDQEFSTINLNGNQNPYYLTYYFGTTAETDATLIDMTLGSAAISTTISGVSVKWTGTAVRLWVWFPDTEAVKTAWSEKDNELNSGEIGGDYNLFGSKVAKTYLGIAGGIYLTNFVTVGKTLIIQ